MGVNLRSTGTSDAKLLFSILMHVKNIYGKGLIVNY